MIKIEGELSQGGDSDKVKKNNYVHVINIKDSSEDFLLGWEKVPPAVFVLKGIFPVNNFGCLLNYTFQF